MYEIVLTKIGPLVLAATPISLILIRKLGNLMSKHNLKLGNATVICTNLNHTLTKTELIVRTIFFDNYKAIIEDEGKIVEIQNLDDKDKITKLEKKYLIKEDTIKILAKTVSLCHFEKTKRIEETLQKLFSDIGFNKHRIRREHEILEKVPTSKEKKYSTIVVRNNETKEIFAFTKGNPQKLLKKCTKVLMNGKKIELTPQIKRKIRKNIETLNKKGQKVLGFAYKPLPLKRQSKYTEQFTENDMTLTGVIGITNPINKNLEESIAIIKQAGIKMYIITKTKEIKAIAIGKILNIINPQYFECITGGYLRRLPDQKIEKMLANKEKDFIFAELKEEDKERIIEILRNMGETVAIVGKSYKNNLIEVVEGILKGRIHNKNYPRFAKHAIACKIAEVILIATALILGTPTPLSISLIIILDIFINLILELAIRAIQTEKKVMTKKYNPQKTKLLNKKHLPEILTTGISTGIIITGIFIWSLVRYGWTPGESIAISEPAATKTIALTFATLASIQIITIFKNGILKSAYLILTALISGLVLYALTNMQISHEKLNLSPLSKIEWEIILFVLIVVILIEEFRKIIQTNTDES